MTVAEVKSIVADLARPFAIYTTSGAAAWATIDIASRVTSGEGGALFMGVVLGGVSALYVGKAFENTRIAGHTAEVEKVRAQASPPPAQALAPAPLTMDEGEIPPDQRVKL
jgi:hypothetical protein